MLLASSILAASFIISMCVLYIANKGDVKASPVEYKQPDIHIHNNNNSHGGYSTSHGSTSDSCSHGGASSSDSDGYGGNSNSDSYSDNDSCSKSDSASSSRNNNSNTKTTTTITNEDNVSEDMIKKEIARLRNELIKKQQMDIKVLDELDRIEELINN